METLQSTSESLESYVVANCYNGRTQFLKDLIPLVLKGIISLESWKNRVVEKENCLNLPYH